MRTPWRRSRGVELGTFHVGTNRRLSVSRYRRLHADDREVPNLLVVAGARATGNHSAGPLPTAILAELSGPTSVLSRGAAGARLEDWRCARLSPTPPRVGQLRRSILQRQRPRRRRAADRLRTPSLPSSEPSSRRRRERSVWPRSRRRMTASALACLMYTAPIRLTATRPRSALRCPTTAAPERSPRRPRPPAPRRPSPSRASALEPRSACSRLPLDEADHRFQWARRCSIPALPLLLARRSGE